MLVKKSPTIKAFMIRGIGYQASVLENIHFNLITQEFPYHRYLIVRVGHSVYKCCPISNNINILVKHKNRKILIYGYNKEQVSNYAKKVYLIRLPNVYTGRGIRIKKEQHKRKVGKKDGKKGKL
jgi:ribosomal protein L6P/L9E